MPGLTHKKCQLILGRVTVRERRGTKGDVTTTENEPNEASNLI